MTDKTDSKEREVAEQWLRDRYGAYRGHFAWRELEEAFLAGRASLAANAGSEPVAGMNEYGVRGYLAATLKCWHRLTGDEAAELVAMTQRLAGLYLHPSPPEGMVGGRMPTFDMRAVVAVAVTMLYETHPEDVCRVFDLRELEKIVGITEPLGSQQVEDIYRSAWDHLEAPPTSSADSRKGE